MNLTGAEQDIAKRTAKVWDEAVTTYQLGDVDFTLVFLNNAKMNARSAQYSKVAVRENHTPAGFALLDRETGKVTVFINRRAVKQDYSHMLNEVVPHELAHIVCMLRPQHGDGHDDGWKEVCIRLGGTGKVTYDTEFDLRRDTRVRKEYIYEIGVNKRRVRISESWHNSIQGGTDFEPKDKRFTITKSDYTGTWI